MVSQLPMIWHQHCVYVWVSLPVFHSLTFARVSKWFDLNLVSMCKCLVSVSMFHSLALARVPNSLMILDWFNVWLFGVHMCINTSQRKGVPVIWSRTSVYVWVFGVHVCVMCQCFIAWHLQGSNRVSTCECQVSLLRSSTLACVSHWLDPSLMSTCNCWRCPFHVLVLS
jgi:hypothetical protein